MRHILPNVLAALIVLATLGAASAIITSSTLSFLGLGVRPPTPEWGNLLADGREFLQHAWWVALFPGLAISSRCRQSTCWVTACAMPSIPGNEGLRRGLPIQGETVRTAKFAKGDKISFAAFA